MVLCCSAHEAIAHVISRLNHHWNTRELPKQSQTSLQTVWQSLLEHLLHGINHIPCSGTIPVFSRLPNYSPCPDSSSYKWIAKTRRPCSPDSGKKQQKICQLALPPHFGVYRRGIDTHQISMHAIWHRHCSDMSGPVVYCTHTFESFLLCTCYTYVLPTEPSNKHLAGVPMFHITRLHS